MANVLHATSMAAPCDTDISPSTTTLPGAILENTMPLAVAPADGTMTLAAFAIAVERVDIIAKLLKRE